MSMKWVVLFVQIYCGVFIVSCGRLERTKQIAAQAKLQYLTSVIEKELGASGHLLSQEELSQRVDAARLQDPWGEQIIYEPYLDNDGGRYILVITGSDRRLDVSTVGEYLLARPERIAEEPKRDVVVVDGQFVRNAGK